MYVCRLEGEEKVPGGEESARKDARLAALLVFLPATACCHYVRRTISWTTVADVTLHLCRRGCLLFLDRALWMHTGQRKYLKRDTLAMEMDRESAGWWIFLNFYVYINFIQIERYVWGRMISYESFVLTTTYDTQLVRCKSSAATIPLESSVRESQGIGNERKQKQNE